MVTFPNAKRVNVGEVELAVYQAGPEPGSTDKPTVVFLHGWPEIAYSWRHQIAVVAAAGYPVLAPDNRGFGGSDKPEGVENYQIAKLTGDCAGLLDAFNIEKAVFVGHDWGAIVLWALPFYQRDRLLGCAGMNVPLMGRPPLDPITMFRATFGEDMYIVRFQNEGESEAILEADLARTFRFFFRKPASENEMKGLEDGAFENEKLNLLDLFVQDESKWGGVSLVSDEDLAVYVQGYQDGMTAPLHWYRNLKHNHDDMAQFVGADGKYPHVDLPCLQFLCTEDRACPPSLAEGMEDRCAPLEIVTLEGCGHWSQMERTEEINTHLLAWLNKYFG